MLPTEHSEGIKTACLSGMPCHDQPPPSCSVLQTDAACRLRGAYALDPLQLALPAAIFQSDDIQAPRLPLHEKDNTSVRNTPQLLLTEA